LYSVGNVLTFLKQRGFSNFPIASSGTYQLFLLILIQPDRRQLRIQR
jgi:hypothetical protein